jgi:hypothetical protein
LPAIVMTRNYTSDNDTHCQRSKLKTS